VRCSPTGIEVSGARVDTPTPAFIHVVTLSKTCANGDMAILDNPFLNNNPNALVFLQIVDIKSAISTTTLWPVDSIGRWDVYHSDPAGIRFWGVGDTFNVLVIDP